MEFRYRIRKRNIYYILSPNVFLYPRDFEQLILTKSRRKISKYKFKKEEKSIFHLLQNVALDDVFSKSELCHPSIKTGSDSFQKFMVSRSILQLLIIIKLSLSQLVRYISKNDDSTRRKIKNKFLENEWNWRGYL